MFVVCIGIEVQLPSLETPTLSRSMLLLCSVDLPAKAAVCNMVQFNGLNVCPTCLDPGDNSVTPAPMLRVWPYSSSSVLRTCHGRQGVFNAVRKAVDKEKMVCTHSALTCKC